MNLNTNRILHMCYNWKLLSSFYILVIAIFKLILDFENFVAGYRIDDVCTGGYDPINSMAPSP